MPYITIGGKRSTTISVRLDDEDLASLERARDKLQQQTAGWRVTRAETVRHLIRHQ